MKKTMLTLLFSVVLSSTAIAEMSDSDKSKAWECSGIYMANYFFCLLYTSPSPRDTSSSRMPSSA